MYAIARKPVSENQKTIHEVTPVEEIGNRKKGLKKKRSQSVPAMANGSVPAKEIDKTVSKVTKPNNGTQVIAKQKKKITAKVTNDNETTNHVNGAASRSESSRTSTTSDAKSPAPAPASTSTAEIGLPPQQNAEKLLKEKLTKYSKKFDVAYKNIPQVLEEATAPGTTNAMQLVVIEYINMDKYITDDVSSRELVVIWSQKLLKHNLVPLLDKWLTSYLDDTSTMNTDKAVQGNLVALLYTLIPLTDCSPPFCEAICRQSLLIHLLQILPQINLAKYQELEQKETMDYLMLIGMFTITHNCLWHQRALTTDIIRATNSMQYARNVFMLTTKDDLRCLVGIQIAYCANESDQSLKEMFTKLLTFILQTLQRCLSLPNHRNNGYSAEEFMWGLNVMITQDESLKERTAMLGFVELYFKYLKAPSDDSELAAAVRGLWLFSFHEKVKIKLKHVQGLQERMAMLHNHENADIKKAADGFLMNLENRVITKEANKTTDETVTDSPKTPGHVMLSYSWANQAIVKQINEGLKRAGYVTWIDIERMKAEYANKRRKPIVPVLVQDKYDADGWLGLLLGNKLYVQCTAEKITADKMSAIVKQIEEVVPNDKSSVGKLYSQTKIRPKAIVAENRPVTPMIEVRNWSTLDVQTWLKMNGLPETAEKLSWVNGKMLLSFKNVHDKQPGMFYKDVCERLQLKNFKDAALLASLLDDLK